MSKDIVKKELDEIKSFVESIDETRKVCWCKKAEWLNKSNVANLGFDISRSICYITSEPEIVETKLEERFDSPRAANVNIVDSSFNGDSGGFVCVLETRTEQGKDPLV